MAADMVQLHPGIALFVFLCAVFGLASAIAVLKFGRYFLGTVKARKGIGRIPYVGDLFYCPPCLAFWIGMAMSKWVLSPSSAVVPVWWQAMLCDGLMACGVVWLLHLLAERLGHGIDV
jgi:hypothetical protein